MWLEDKMRTSDLPGIRIAIIAEEAMLSKMTQCLKGFPSFNPIYKCYSKESAAPMLAEEAEEEADVILFSGVIPYLMAKQNHHFKVPVLFVPLTGSGLYRSLIRLERKEGLIASMSVDTLTKPMIETALEEVGAANVDITVYEGISHTSRQELLAFHREEYRSGRARCALTAVRSIAVQLAEEEIPCEWIVPTEQDIIVTLERALLSTDWRRNKEAQIVMGIIHVDNFARLADSQASEHEVQRLKLDIHYSILHFIEQLDGHLTQLAANEYLFVTTRGIFERETGGYKRIPLAKKAQRALGVLLSIGVGFGHTAGEAGKHARQSLRLAADGGGNNCFIVREDKSVIGPLEMTEPMELDLSLVEAGLVRKAEEAGMTSLYLSKLLTYTTRSGRMDYYAQELASVLGVTTRSVHRFLLAWMDAGLVEIVGEQRGVSRGRPRQKYRLSFLDSLIR